MTESPAGAGVEETGVGSYFVANYPPFSVWTEAALADAKAALAALRGFGVTRLSLGVENFDDRILDLNGRAHRSPEIFRVYQQARALDFPQINIDLIGGMLGETDENWKQCIERTVALSQRQSVEGFH